MLKSDIGIGLIYNIALLLMLGMIYMILPIKKMRKYIYRQIVVGLFISTIGIAVMANPFVIMPGIQFDARSIVLSISGLFFGIIPTFITSLVTVSLRLYMGGEGAFAGVLVILCSAIIGLFWNRLYYTKLVRKKINRLSNSAIFGLIVHIVYLGCLFVIPWPKSLIVFQTIAVPLLSIFPIGTVLLALIFFYKIDIETTESDLKKSKENLFSYINKAPYGIFLSDENNNFLDANNAALNMTGYTLSEIKQLKIADISEPDNTEVSLNRHNQLKKDGVLNVEKRNIDIF